MIVTIVLLNDAWMCATPDWTFLTSRFLRVLVCFLAAKVKTPNVLSCPQTTGLSSPRPVQFRSRERPDLHTQATANSSQGAPDNRGGKDRVRR